MKLSTIKKKMLEYRDFYGMDIPQSDMIEKAKTKRELKSVLDDYFRYIEDRERDAKSHFNKFYSSLKLNVY